MSADTVKRPNPAGVIDRIAVELFLQIRQPPL